MFAGFWSLLFFWRPMLKKRVQIQKFLSLNVEDDWGPRLLARRFLGSSESGTLNMSEKFLHWTRQKKDSVQIIHCPYPEIIWNTTLSNACGLVLPSLGIWLQDFEHCFFSWQPILKKGSKHKNSCLWIMRMYWGPQLLARRFLGSSESGTLNCLKNSFIGQWTRQKQGTYGKEGNSILPY